MNSEDLTLKQMFDITAKLVGDQDEINGLDNIHWGKNSWRQLSLIGDETVPTSWMCKKQTSVSHSSTEAEIISLDAGSRMDGIPALTLLIGIW